MTKSEAAEQLEKLMAKYAYLLPPMERQEIRRARIAYYAALPDGERLPAGVSMAQVAELLRAMRRGRAIDLSVVQWIVYDAIIEVSK